MIENAGERHDLYAAALPRTGDDPAEWKWSGPFYTKPKEAESVVLASLLAAQGPIKNSMARHLMGLGYAALAAAHICRRSKDVLAREPLVAVGYDEGDFVRPRDLLRWTKSTRRPLNQADLGNHEIAWAGPSLLLVTRKLAGILADAGTTGLRFQPVRVADLA